MTSEILMPALSPTMEEGTLAKWLVKEGDSVSAGDILAEIETDKATMEFEAVDEGTIGKILVSEGSEGIKVNSPIAILIEDGEKISEKEILEVSHQDVLSADTNTVEPKSRPATTELVIETEWTDATKVKQQTVREALRDAMAEELDAMKLFSSWEKKLLNIKEHIKSVRAYWKNLAQRELLILQLLNMVSPV